jgi:hypothetical protein
MRKCEHQLFIRRGTELVTTTEPDREVGGRVVKGKVVTATVPCREISTVPGGLWRGGEAGDIKVRVPLPELIKIPAKGGFQEFVKAYDEAVKKLTGSTGTGEQG